MSVVLDGIGKTFDGNRVIHDLHIAFGRSRSSILLGASGCGKTTTLRCIAGLEQPDAGAISIGDREVFSAARGINLPPERRELGMVFQSYAVWPHMTVAENVMLPLSARGVRGSEARRRVTRALDRVGLGGLEARSATRLSGGQQQRVALARCIVAEASVVLLDEPLSNLDARLRVAMRQELRALQRQLGITMILVTHDQEEAMSVGDEVFLFNQGRIVQSGDPRDLYLLPRNRFAAEFFGKANFLPVSVCEIADGEDWLRTTTGPVLSGPAPPTGLATRSTTAPRNEACLCVIRPEAWHLRQGPVGDGESDWLPAEVAEIMFLGNRTELILTTPLGEQTVTQPGVARLSIGDRVGLRTTLEFLHLIADGSNA